MTKRRLLPRLLAAAVVLLAVVLAAGYYWRAQPGGGYEVESGFAPVQDAFHKHRSDFMTEVSGAVVRILMDDKSDLRNQKFIIRLENGQSLLIVHDQVAAKRVPVAIDDTVTVRGLYRWSETGGTVEFTHRDPSAKRRHGWIDHAGKRYQ